MLRLVTIIASIALVSSLVRGTHAPQAVLDTRKLEVIRNRVRRGEFSEDCEYTPNPSVWGWALSENEPA